MAYGKPYYPINNPKISNPLILKAVKVLAIFATPAYTALRAAW
jgi:hypothetical protein